MAKHKKKFYFEELSETEQERIVEQLFQMPRIVELNKQIGKIFDAGDVFNKVESIIKRNDEQRTKQEWISWSVTQSSFPD